MKEPELEPKARETETLNAELRELRRYVQELELLADERGARLTEIRQSKGWRLLQVLYRARYALFPSGSRRECWARSCAGKLRQARQQGRRGPWELLRVSMDALARPFRRGRGAGSMAASAGQGERRARLARVQPERDPGVGTPGLVSVVLPVYNQAGLLSEAIESVLNQTHADLELIVVDDGSTDDVAAVLKRYADHPKVRVLRQPNQGLPKALSNGFEFAAGEFWTWTSADNLMGREQLARQLDFLRRHPAVAMVYANYLTIDDRGEPLCDSDYRPHNRPGPDRPEVHLPHDPEPLNTVEDNFIGACFLYRAWAGRVAGEYAPGIGLEDYDYWMRMNALVRIAHLDSDECLYRYRVHDNTLSAQAGELRIIERVQRLMKYERERQEAYAQPWTILVDQPTSQWLTEREAGANRVLGLDELWLLEDDCGKKLVLIRADSLAQIAQRRLPAQTCVAVWFGADGAEVYRRRRELREVADVCFAPDREMAERVALFHRAVFVAAPGPELCRLAGAFGNRHLFYEATVPAAKRVRALPEPFEITGRRRRVLLQVDKFLQGGFEQVVIDVATTLKQEGFDPVILVLGQPGAAVFTARELGLRVLTLPGTAREAHYRELLREEKIELVNAHFSVLGVEVARELRIPFVQTMHTSYVFLRPGRLAGFRAADAATTAYICTSGNTALYADVRMGLSVDKMLIAPNGIDLERLQLEDRAAARAGLREELGLAADDFVFLNVGTIYRDKGQKLVVSALRDVLREYPHAKLVLLGSAMDDQYMQDIEQEIEQAGLASAVIIADHREDVAAFYAMADAFVLPSFWEGWSLALAEALCMNLPIIATDVGSARELLPPRGARLIPPVFETIADLEWGNVEDYVGPEQPRLVADLAAAMKQVCADPVAPGLSEAARRALDRREAYQAYVRLFRWLLQGGTPASARAWLRAGAGAAGAGVIAASTAGEQ